MERFAFLLLVFASGIESRKNVREMPTNLPRPKLFLEAPKSVKYDGNVQVFSQTPSYNGTWAANASNQPLFNGFINRQGKSEVYIDVPDTSSPGNYRVLVNFCDQKYLDTKEAYIVFNLSSAKYDPISSSFYLNATNNDTNDLAFARFHQDHLIYWYIPDVIDLQVNMTLIDATTLKPFNITNQTDPTVDFFDSESLVNLTTEFFSSEHVDDDEFSL